MARVVVDTNVLVSAILKKGKSRNFVARLLDKNALVLSSQMLAELTDVLCRDKFCIASSSVEKYISILIRGAIMVPLTSNSKVVAEDPDDDVILNTAISGKANYIVSGDKHLLKIVRYKNIQILSINEFISKQEKE